ncbi:MAG: response regulator transcription factor [Melioribacteraceae bacterium]|nr:response regulator transcription factor [Melioribacteraceae bacterium]
MIRVLLADDHSLFREGIISMLKDNTEIDIVGEAADGKELIIKFSELLPDVVLSDINMPIKSGPNAVKSILNRYSNAKVLFLTQFTGDDYLYSVVKSGAFGLISKTCMKNELIFAIKEVYDGRKYFKNKSADELNGIIKRFEDIRMQGMDFHLSVLTPKEREVLNLVGEGLTSEQIAKQLNMSKRTVDTHRHRIITTLGLNSVSELIRYAVLRNLEENKKNSLFD